MLNKLSNDQQNRYARHIKLENFGEAGQLKLLNSNILLIGAGGLGSPVCLYLAAAGIGKITIMDDDCVDISNLQRQVAHKSTEVGRNKAESAADACNAINPECRITAVKQRFSSANKDIIAGHDFVIDATDNFDSKFLIADACHEFKVPYSHGGLLQYHAQVMTVIPGQTTCYRCLFDAPPQEMASDKSPSGPLGPLPGIIGSIQAAEAVKYLSGVGQLLTDCLLTCDMLTMQFRKIPTQKSDTCILCG